MKPASAHSSVDTGDRKAPEGGLRCFFHFHGRRVEYVDRPSELTVGARDISISNDNMHPLTGAALHWLLADACSLHLEQGLAGRRINETEADRKERIAIKREKSALAKLDQAAKNL